MFDVPLRLIDALSYMCFVSSLFYSFARGFFFVRFSVLINIPEKVPVLVNDVCGGVRVTISCIESALDECLDECP